LTVVKQFSARPTVDVPDEPVVACKGPTGLPVLTTDRPASGNARK
jgi:hypothetical protein